MIIATIALMIVYLVLATGLAIRYDRAFFINDAIALALFAVLLIGLVIHERRTHRD